MQLPETADVASLIQARTKPRLGEGSDTGDFSEGTRPTADQVTTVIERAGRAVYLVLGSWDDLSNEELQQAILDLVALRAACEVERSFWPGQSEAKDSTAKSLEARYERDLKVVEQALLEAADAGIQAGDGVLPRANGLPGDDAVIYPYPQVIVVTDEPWQQPSQPDRW